MTTLGVDSPYWQSSLWLLLVGVGSGMFNSPNTAAMMGVVPANRRGVAAGARMMLQNTGAVLSIAFVMAIVTAAVPKDVLLAIFSGVATGLSQAQLDPFIHNMHTALWVLAATSVVGAFVSLLRPTTAQLREAEAGARHDHRHAAAHRRGGGAARHHDRARSATTRRSGCSGGGRARGRPPPHLRGGRRRAPQRRPALQAAARPQPRGAQGAARGRGGPRRAARRVARAQPRRVGRRREILEQALGHIDRQLELVRRRRQDIDALEASWPTSVRRSSASCASCRRQRRIEGPAGDAFAPYRGARGRERRRGAGTPNLPQCAVGV